MQPDKAGYWNDGKQTYSVRMQDGKLHFDFGSGVFVPLEYKTNNPEKPWKFVSEFREDLYFIYFVHGYNEALAKRIESYCQKIGNQFIYIGSLDKFRKHHTKIFAVSGESIWITQYNGFGQR